MLSFDTSEQILQDEFSEIHLNGSIFTYILITKPITMNQYPASLLITFIGIFIFSNALSCDDNPKNHDLSVQYCLATTPELFDYSGVISEDFIGIELKRDNIKWSGGIYGTYRYFFMKIMSVSTTFGYNRIWSDLVNGGEIYGESIRDYYTVAAEWNIHYLRFEHFQMYSGGGLGATFMYEDNSYYQRVESANSESNIYPNFNFTLVGVRFGGNLAVFMESGIGYKGFFAFGLSLQF